MTYSNYTPYIGVTDFTSVEQVHEVLTCIPAEANRRLHVGAMISYKTLNQIPTKTGWENIWLDEPGLNNLFKPNPAVYNVIHYADYDNLTTLDHLLEAVNKSGPGVDAVQLDMKWPSHHLVAQLRYALDPKIQIIQQIGSTAIAESSNWERDMAVYQGIVDYVLLDCGMGRGIPFDPLYMNSLVETALRYFSEHQIAVAGGLGPQTYDNMRHLLKKYPSISCDAQGKLRSSGSAVDPLDLELVKQYVSGVCSLITNP